MLVIRISSRIGHIKIQGTQHVRKIYRLVPCLSSSFYFLGAIFYTRRVHTCMHWTNRLVNLNWPGDTNLIY
jgi:hypothetical protein